MINIENGPETRNLSAKPLDIYKQYLKNTNIAEPYEAEILWALRKKEPLGDLFRKSAELVGRLLDDPEFSDLCQERFRQDT